MPEKMTVYDLFAVQRDMNKLKSLYMELADHEKFNPYKNNSITGMPHGGKGVNFTEWYVEKKEEIEKEIEYYKLKIQKDREEIDQFIQNAPYPECDIIRYRVINNLGWFEIGEILCIHRTAASKKFYNYINNK